MASEAGWPSDRFTVLCSVETAAAFSVTCLLLRRGVGFRLGCRSLRVGRSLLRLLQFRVLGSQVGLQASIWPWNSCFMASI